MAFGCEFMISKDELSKIKEIRKISLYHSEKEYFQYLFLNAISKYADKFTFKGGTCLRIIYEIERASEDLDFSTKLSVVEIKKLVYECIKSFEYLNIKCEISKELEYDGNYRIEIRFYGPLYENDKRTTNTLKIDFSKREVIHKIPAVIKKIFSDIPPFSIIVMDKKEILAEKIRALLMRVQARDLYDVWILLSLGEKIDKGLLFKKLNEDKIKVFKIKFPSKKEYESDLKLLIKHTPNYENVSKIVEENLIIFENEKI